MEKDNEQKSSGFNGFVLGVIVGVVLTLLFTTKKGRKLLKSFSDQSLNKFAEIEDLMEEIEEEDYDEESVPKKQSHSAKEEKNGSYSDSEGDEQESIVATMKAPIKRFFRGIPKRVS